MLKQSKIQRLLISMSLLILSNCASVDINSLNVTPMDEEFVKDMIDFKSVDLSNVSIFIESETKSNLQSAFGDAFKTATERLIKGLGGATVVKEKKSWGDQLKEADTKIKKKLKEKTLTQKLGDKEKEIEKVETKFNSWYVINADLNNATYQTKYFPPVQVTDSKGNVSMTQPTWKTTVTVYVFFKVTSTDPGQPESVVLIKNISNSFSQSFSKEPSQREVFALFPEAILYCYEDIKPDLQELFPIKSYLTDLREEKQYGKVIGGKDIGVTEGRVFDILEKGSITTAVGNKDLFHPVGKLKVFEVLEKESWGKISGSKEEIKKGMNVIIRPERRTIFDFIWRIIKSNLGLQFPGGDKK